MKDQTRLTGLDHDTRCAVSDEWRSCYMAQGTHRLSLGTGGPC